MKQIKSRWIPAFLTVLALLFGGCLNNVVDSDEIGVDEPQVSMIQEDGGYFLQFQLPNSKSRGALTQYAAKYFLRDTYEIAITDYIVALNPGHPMPPKDRVKTYTVSGEESVKIPVEINKSYRVLILAGHKTTRTLLGAWYGETTGPVTGGDKPVTVTMTGDYFEMGIYTYPYPYPSTGAYLETGNLVFSGSTALDSVPLGEEVVYEVGQEETLTVYSFLFYRDTPRFENLGMTALQTGLITNPKYAAIPLRNALKIEVKYDIPAGATGSLPTASLDNVITDKNGQTLIADYVIAPYKDSSADGYILDVRLETTYTRHYYIYFALKTPAVDCYLRVYWSADYRPFGVADGETNWIIRRGINDNAEAKQQNSTGGAIKFRVGNPSP